jgi:hypothetical protein
MPWSVSCVGTPTLVDSGSWCRGFLGFRGPGRPCWCCCWCWCCCPAAALLLPCCCWCCWCWRPWQARPCCGVAPPPVEEDRQQPVGLLVPRERHRLLPCARHEPQACQLDCARSRQLVCKRARIVRSCQVVCAYGRGLEIHVTHQHPSRIRNTDSVSVEARAEENWCLPDSLFSAPARMRLCCLGFESAPPTRFRHIGRVPRRAVRAACARLRRRGPAL